MTRFCSNFGAVLQKFSFKVAVFRLYKTKRYTVFRNFRVISMRFSAFLCCSVRCFYVFLCGFGVFVPPLSPHLNRSFLFFFFFLNPAGIMFKTEPIRKLSNFDFYWTKTLYPSNLNKIKIFFAFFKGYRYKWLSVITPKTISHGSP